MTGRGSSPPARTRGRASVVVIVVVIVLVLVAIAAAIFVFHRPLRYGRVQPPEIVLDHVEPALASRLRRLRAEVLAAPYDADAWGALACTFDVHDYPAEAAACYRRAQRLDPDEFRWPYFLGRALVMTDQDAAIVNLRRAAAIRDDYAPLHVHLGRSLILQERPDEAAAAFARAVGIDRENIRAHIGLAGVALERDEPREALGHLERALALGPKAEETYWQLAQAHRRLGDAVTADRYVALAREQEVYLEPMPDPIRNEQTDQYGVTTTWRRTRAERYSRSGRPDLALAEWEQAVRDDPDSVEAHIEAGRLKAQLGDVDGAIDSLTRGLALDPERHPARNNLGVMLVQRGRLEAGLDELRRSSEAMPDNADAHFNLAMGWRTAGRPGETHAALERTLAIDPEHVRARFEYGVTLARAGRLEDAVAAFRRVVAAGGAPRAAYANLAFALEKLGRAAETVAVLREARAAMPNDASIVRDLAWRLATSPDASVRNGAEAVDLMESVIGATGQRDPALLDVLAAAYAEIGDFASAGRVVAEALDRLDGRETPTSDIGGVGPMQARLGLYASGRPYRAGG